ncbi:unnamed protein product, partial [Musa acuminata subsp. burmannicoides]
GGSRCGRWGTAALPCPPLPFLPHARPYSFSFFLFLFLFVFHSFRSSPVSELTHFGHPFVILFSSVSMRMRMRRSTIIMLIKVTEMISGPEKEIIGLVPGASRPWHEAPPPTWK